MEEKLDKIAEKQAVWNVVLKEFYTPFMEVVNSVMKTAQKVVIESDKVCPNCGRKMLVRTSRFGSQFLGCSGYPECKTIISLNNSVELDSENDNKTNEPQVTDEKCEKCGGSMVMKIGPYGKYLECTECKNRKKYIRSTGVKCPKCGEGTIIEKKSKYGKIFFGCNKYPDCSFALWDEPTGNTCPECGELLVKKVTKNGTFESCSSRTCTYKKAIETPEKDGGEE
jgi:DNA topoisomerase-1